MVLAPPRRPVPCRLAGPAPKLYRTTNGINRRVLKGTELWMDGNPPAGWQPSAVPWIGAWVDDPDKMCEKIKAHGVKVDPPEGSPTECA